MDRSIFYDKKEILNKSNGYFIYIIFIIIFSPIFLSLDFSNGFKFDAWVGNLYFRPSIPISLILLCLISILYLKQLLKNKKLLILFGLIGLYTLLNLYNGTTRAVIVGFGMFIPVISFYIFKNLLNTLKNVYKVMYLALFSVIIIKFIFDIYHLYISLKPAIVPTISSILDSFIEYKFNTQHYVFRSIMIYNYLDYFPFIYYLAVILSINNIKNKIMESYSLFLLIISILAVAATGSRLFSYGIVLIPILYIFYKTTKFKLETYFYLFMLISISVSLAIGLVDFNFNDSSLATRNILAYKYFNDLSFLNVILPFMSQHRMETVGSFHNELLEIFSFFGLTIIYYYYLIMKIYSGVNEEYKLISYFLMFIIIVGALIQINISNPYVGIMLGMILAVLTLESKNERIVNAKI
ncbi:hypothetical protein [Sulfurimonas sp.]|uniref:hypothetical protein n=1 Tax=Sulfurimonas sp. TaxID=2022749 RepID=UPI00263995DB|nr:hypothetical protein [Sulfurimonas sp.]MCW8895355.1 hypothetical protein [Sulfurimonas sp.]MCW9067498.1 hypothetical protein [Sulfurimonas sp.]